MRSIFEIIQDAFDSCQVDVVWFLHKLANLIHSIYKIQSGNGEVL